MLSKARIRSIKAREILNSLGEKTIEVELSLDSKKVFASVPMGQSRGKYEAKTVDVKRAIKNINQIICPKLKGKSVVNQTEIDEFLINLDGTKNKSRLGANAILAVSLAVLKGGALCLNLPLFKYISQIFEGQIFEGKKVKEYKMPLPCFNIINGGVHASGGIQIQEFMIVPQEKKFKENLEKGVMIYKKLKEVLKEKYQNGSTNLGDEGGYVPPIKKTKEALNLIEKTIKRLGYQKKIKLGLDCASSQFFKNGRYFLEGEVLNREGLLKFYEKILKEYPILFLEDPFSENDLKGWEILYDKYQEKKDFYIVGDDLTVSNPLRITMAKEKKLINALILKPNQIGTITEVFESSRLCKKFGFKIIVSHRSQETNDDFIADLAVGIKADFIKSGAPARGERVAKYNRLLKIEEEILNE